MQNAGLPEAGDAVLSLPHPHPAPISAPTSDAASLAPSGHVYASSAEAARRRRDLAVEGFNELREGKRSLERFYELAAGIAAPLVPAWREAWETGSNASRRPARSELIGSLEDGGVPPLAAAMFGIDPPAGEVLGLCGRLNVYPSVDGVPVI